MLTIHVETSHLGIILVLANIVSIVGIIKSVGRFCSKEYEFTWLLGQYILQALMKIYLLSFHQQLSPHPKSTNKPTHLRFAHFHQCLVLYFIEGSLFELSTVCFLCSATE